MTPGHRVQMGAAACAIAVAGALAGCPAAVPVVGPVASCVSIVLADALKGDTVAQILADAGPTCVTSAEEVIAILLGSADPAVHATKAFAEAMASRGAK